VWGMAIQPPKNAQQYKDILLQKKKMSLEEAVFRSEKAFRPANLQEYSSFWEDEILKDHPHKQNLLKWIKGVDIDDFLNSFTDSEYQGVRIHSHFPQNKEFSNYVPEEFEQFMDDTVTEWEQMGVLLEWEKVRKEGDPLIPVVVSPLGVEPTKPRALWDGRYVNEFCRDIPFSMDNASKVAEVAWGGVIFSNLTIKMGIFMSLLKKDRENILEFFGKESITFLQCYLLDGSQVPLYTILSPKLWQCILGP